MPGACLGATGSLDPQVFRLFGAWQNAGTPERQAVARGEAIFNTRQFVIDNVAGLNGGPQDPVAVPIRTGTCTVCHDTPNAGNHSVSMALNIGIADPSRRTADLPLYTLRNRASGDIVQTTDPRRAVVTGKWKDVASSSPSCGRWRAGAVAPRQVGRGSGRVAFYDTRFRLQLTDREKADLIAFLRSL